jgi:outer membrane protein assembly factor BamB
MSLCEDCIAAAEAERVAARSQAQEDADLAAASRSVDQLIFVGLNGYALALDRDTGQIVWSNGQMKSGYVSLLLDGDRLIVSTNGYMYCLDPLTGKILWYNPLTGYGAGAPTHLISVRGQSSQTQVQQAAADEAARSSAAHAGQTGGS